MNRSAKDHWLASLPECEFRVPRGTEWWKWDWSIGLTEFKPVRDNAVVKKVDELLRAGKVIRVSLHYDGSGEQQFLRMVGVNTEPGRNTVAMADIIREHQRQCLI